MLTLKISVIAKMLLVFFHFSNAGISRSSTVIMAYLMKYKKMTLDDALELVQKARPIAMPNIGFLVKLQEYGLNLK